MGDAGILHRSSLPPSDILELHVSTAEFLGLITADVEFRGELLEKLAEAFHKKYQSISPNSPAGKKKYSQLDECDKEKNREAVRGIPYKLAALGYLYEEIDNNPQKSEIHRLTDRDAEMVGRIEHDRWMIDMVDNGYVYGKIRNDKSEQKTHPDIVPWDPETALLDSYPPAVASCLGPGPLKNPVDLELAKMIPEIMNLAGYRVYNTR